MSTVNKVIIIGNLGNDPDIRSFPSGGKVANLSLATSERWKDKQTGEQKERTEWHRVAVYNEGLVRVCEQYLKKGSKVYIEGQLETRKWQDQSGQDRYSTEVALRPYRSELQMLDAKQDGQKPSYQEPSGGAPAGGTDLDEIPFLMEWRG